MKGKSYDLSVLTAFHTHYAINFSLLTFAIK